MSHVRVAIRMKPATEADASTYVTKVPPGTMMLSKPGEEDMFSFNFSHAMTCVDNGQLHETVGKPIVESVLEGYNATLLAYGQTGSGKTYSILGPECKISGAARTKSFASAQLSSKMISNCSSAAVEIFCIPLLCLAILSA